ncbi:MAG: hypothetical protein A2934_01360 [Candidatus Sungbacteria bacterium RIFCSPLOWO2_01_FULL_47_10]|uniref:acylphosphatase n=1 Tax=Candidatus Sungbacteria bacterium RIFCSPLOWO2_01_FULL_47_10 TaxID=1802276 RepID=A0A1G2KYY5_9BACT|nr:MAG: hypothetical protein A2934_01360 [Candidatus Sungbacteria bacterium RIFCSPLOWO2_01_FULL_47_10]
MLCVTLKIFGDVQGVFFRQTTKEYADRLGISGIVQNEEDGSVSVAAEGEKEALEKLIVAAKNGFGYTKVDTIKTEWGNAAGQYRGFAAL